MRNKDTNKLNVDFVGYRAFEFHKDVFQAPVPSQLYDMGQ